MGAQENIDLTRQGYAAFGSGDMEALSGLIADDAVWHVGGRSALAGDYTGKEAIFGLFGMLAEKSEMTLSLDIHDIAASDDHVVTLTTMTAGGSGGRTLEIQSADVTHIRNGQIAEFWSMPSDQYAFDEYYGS